MEGIPSRQPQFHRHLRLERNSMQNGLDGAGNIPLLWISGTDDITGSGKPVAGY
jgi:hypothetical protein